MPGLLPYNERELRSRLASGDESAYRLFFDHWWKRVYGNALRFTKDAEQAEDMAQEVFIKIWVNREKLAQVESLENYLYFVARNVFVDHLRKKVLHTDNSLYLDTWFENEGSSAQSLLESRDLEKIIHSAIEQLPPQMQTVFRLSRLEGLTHEQIAERMQISKATSQSYIVRALVQIKQYLADHHYPLELLSLYVLVRAGNFF